MIACDDCELPYESSAFADFVVSDATWAALTAADGAQILCVKCMTRRAALLGITAEGAFTSGPFAAHGWRKPA